MILYKPILLSLRITIAVSPLYNMRACYPQPRVVVVVVIMVSAAVEIAEKDKLYRFIYTMY